MPRFPKTPTLTLRQSEALQRLFTARGGKGLPQDYLTLISLRPELRTLLEGVSVSQIAPRLSKFRNNLPNSEWKKLIALEEQERGERNRQELSPALNIAVTCLRPLVTETAWPAAETQSPPPLPSLPLPLPLLPQPSAGGGAISAVPETSESIGAGMAGVLAITSKSRPEIGVSIIQRAFDTNPLHMCRPVHSAPAAGESAPAVEQIVLHEPSYDVTAAASYLQTTQTTVDSGFGQPQSDPFEIRFVIVRPEPERRVVEWFSKTPSGTPRLPSSHPQFI